MKKFMQHSYEFLPMLQVLLALQDDWNISNERQASGYFSKIGVKLWWKVKKHLKSTQNGLINYTIFCILFSEIWKFEFFFRNNQKWSSKYQFPEKLHFGLWATYVHLVQHFLNFLKENITHNTSKVSVKNLLNHTVL